jgi:hypothetical protein
MPTPWLVVHFHAQTEHRSYCTKPLVTSTEAYRCISVMISDPWLRFHNQLAPVAQALRNTLTIMAWLMKAILF